MADPGLLRATAQDIPRLQAMLAEAFFDDPVFGWLIPNDTKRRARLRRYFGIELRQYALPHGHVWTTDDLAGAMLGLPPGKWRAPLHTTLLHGSVFRVRVPRAARLGAAMGGGGGGGWVVHTGAGGGGGGGGGRGLITTFVTSACTRTRRDVVSAAR